MNLELVFGNDLLDMDIVNNDPWALAQKVGVTVLSNNELYAAYVDHDIGRVVAAVFVSSYGDFGFDTVVDPAYQGKGLGSKLIDMAMNEWKERSEADPDAKLSLDVINPGIIDYLKREYGLAVLEQWGGHYIMGRTCRLRVCASNV